MKLNNSRKPPKKSGGFFYKKILRIESRLKFGVSSIEFGFFLKVNCVV